MGDMVSKYIAEMRHLADTCKFGEFLEDSLRDHVVCGLHSKPARRRLLADVGGEISLAKAIDQAQKNQQAEISAKSLKNAESSVNKLCSRN